ncbi:MAG: hypothetical protein IV094_14575 [Vitreoscilla sp.]|nr:hypothetical protein [Vitreoscilla sp.]
MPPHARCRGAGPLALSVAAHLVLAGMAWRHVQAPVTAPRAAAAAAAPAPTVWLRLVRAEPALVAAPPTQKSLNEAARPQAPRSAAARVANERPSAHSPRTGPLPSQVDDAASPPPPPPPAVAGVTFAPARLGSPLGGGTSGGFLGGRRAAAGAMPTSTITPPSNWPADESLRREVLMAMEQQAQAWPTPADAEPARCELLDALGPDDGPPLRCDNALLAQALAAPLAALRGSLQAYQRLSPGTERLVVAYSGGRYRLHLTPR